MNLNIDYYCTWQLLLNLHVKNRGDRVKKDQLMSQGKNWHRDTWWLVFLISWFALCTNLRRPKTHDSSKTLISGVRENSFFLLHRAVWTLKTNFNWVLCKGLSKTNKKNTRSFIDWMIETTEWVQTFSVAVLQNNSNMLAFNCSGFPEVLFPGKNLKHVRVVWIHFECRPFSTKS